MEVILYGLLAVIVIAFWRAARGRSVDQLLEAAHRHHRPVHRVNDIQSVVVCWILFRSFL